MTGGLVATGLAAAVVTALALAALLPLLRRAGVVDVPVGRSLHDGPVARGAGLALVPGLLAATAVGLLLPATGAGVLDATLGVLAVVAGTLALATVGLLDDLYGISVAARLALQLGTGLALGVAAVAVSGRSAAWVPLVALVVLVVVNVTNFMDGANGLLGLHGLVTGGWYAVLAVAGGGGPLTGAAVVAAGLAGAAAGFLPFNAPRARAFLGDVGSYLLGAAWALLGVWLLLGGRPVEAVAAPLLVFLADTAYTLQLRLRAGHRWYEPHKLHVYQRLVTAGWPHLRAAGLVAGVAAVCALLAVPAASGAPVGVRLLAVAAMGALCAAYLRLPVWVGAPAPWRGGPR